MTVDRSYVSENDFADYMAGFIRVRIGLFGGREVYSGTALWGDPACVPQTTKVNLAVNLIRAIDLPSGDDDGLSDPFVEFEHFGTSMITPACIKSLDPMWNQRFIMSSYVIENNLLPLIVNVFDSDSDDMKKFDFLGRALIKLPDFITKSEDVNVIPKPEWHELYLSSKIKIGKIMLSVQVLQQDWNMKIMPLAFDMKQYRLKFKLLGLRNFQSSGMLPIKKPYIKMNMSALRVKSSTGTHFDFLTANSMTGNSNANFGDIINKTVVLPQNANLLPTISVRHC